MKVQAFIINMSTESLTREQQSFLEECNLEFSDRFTDADLDYKKVFEEGVPSPPIMYPWYGRIRLIANRNRAGGSRYNANRGDHSERNDKDRDRRNDRNYENRGYRDRYSDRHSRDVRYKPY